MEEQKRKVERPKVNSTGQNELDKAQQQFEAFDESCKKMTLDRMNQAPVKETEQQTQLSQKQIQKNNDLYLKPDRRIEDRQKFNEDYRQEWNFQKEYVNFTAEHKELIGETIEMWTHPFGGVGAEFWKVPTNKPLWAPRYVAEQIKRKKYHRLVMRENVMTQDLGGVGHMYGAMAVETTIQRLDAHPVFDRKSVFMGASGF